VCHGSDARAQFYAELIYLLYIIYKLITCIASRTTETDSFTIAEGSLVGSLNTLSKRPILLLDLSPSVRICEL
jgi:hypothetical protein